MRLNFSTSQRIRRAAKRVLLLPISPPIFALLTNLLRRTGVLRTPSANGDSIRTIFVSHPYSSVGDLVLLLPLLEKIKEVWPQAAVDIAVGSGASQLLAGCAGLRHIFVCGSQNSRFRLFGIYRRTIRNLLIYRRAIMPFDYDLAISARWGSIMTQEAVYLARSTGARERIGYSAAVDDGDPTMDRLLTRVARCGGHEHEIVRNLKLFERVGLTPPMHDIDSLPNRPITALLNLAQLTQSNLTYFDQLPTHERYGVVSPGAMKPFNRWPIERVAQTVNDIAAVTGMRFYIIGSPLDVALCNRLALLTRDVAISIAGRTNLGQLTALLSQAALFLGMDSGTAHIAGGLGVPTLVITPFPSGCTLEHPNSSVRFRPPGPRVRVLQPISPSPPCSPTCLLPEPHCILQISAHQVTAAGLELLASASSDPILTPGAPA